MQNRDVVLVDAVRTAFGKAGEKGIFWSTRADDMVVTVIKELVKRNPKVKPEMIEENAWGVCTQEKDQGTDHGPHVGDSWQACPRPPRAFPSTACARAA